MPYPHLFQELVDGILDHLRDDVRALKKCSLVSKSFLPTAQRHLFSTLDLDSSPHGHRISKRLQISLTLNPILSQYIRSLNFRLHWEMRGAGDTLVKTLKMFPHLRSFTLRSSSMQHIWSDLHACLRFALLGILQQDNLTSASITGVRNFPLSAFMHCQNLKHISIEGVVVDDVEPPLSSLSSPRGFIGGQLEMLSGGEWESGAGSTRRLIEFLMSRQSSLRLSRLRYFAAAMWSDEDSSVFQRVLNTCARSLEDLALSIHSKGEYRPCLSDSDFSFLILTTPVQHLC